MDTILNELGGKWKTLTKDTQVALAQTVAGTRQYTQLVALMDNWDFMESNIATSKSSNGALQRQANIYAESWEAASKRVKAAAEEIFAELLDDKLFIGALNGIASLIEGVDTLIDRLGGLPGVLSTVGMILTRVFS
jgi:TP901 family phage tail tape measure protein